MSISDSKGPADLPLPKRNASDSLPSVLDTSSEAMEKQLTAYREVEQHLSMLNLILSATSDSVYLFDTQCRYLFASESAAKRLGLTQSDFVGKTWQELGLPAEFVAPFAAHFQTVLSNGQTIVNEMLFPLSSGLRWIEYVVKPVIGQDGAIEAVAVSTKDVTERRQAADSLRRLASIVESSDEAILSKTLDGVITSWNRGSEKLYGYSAEEIIGQSILVLFPSHLHHELWDVLTSVRMGEVVKDHESIRIKKNGTPVEVIVTVSPIPDHKGRIIGAATIAHDITESKRLVRKLQDINTALKEANQVRDQFISTMSHEMRTPLASIIGFSEMLLKDVPETEANQDEREDLQCILRNGYHMLELVNDVLDLEKIQARRMGITFTPVDVKHLLTAVVEETQSIAAVQQLILRVEVEEEIGCIDSDQTRLQQVLLNLVSNALKFTKQGEVIVSARRVVGSAQQGESVAISVRDSGIGVALDKQEQIFKAFYQVDGSYTREFGGTGLGLSIVSQLTKLLGGTIDIDSAPGQGSIFTVTLPIRAARQPIIEDVPRLYQEAIATLLPHVDDIKKLSPQEHLLEFVKQAESRGQSNVVLVVDDDPDAIILIKEALQLTPLRAVGVQDSTQVLDLVQTLHPCAITLDVMMPQINGWQLLHQLKNNPISASIPVVMISVLSEQTTGYVLGADAYLLKPIKIDELVNTFQSIMKIQQSVNPVQLPETLLVAKDDDEIREEARI